MKRICVFAGSSHGLRGDYADTTRSLARALAVRKLDLVYGGGDIGLMGILADTALEEGGQVIGVIPRALADREIAHLGLTDLRIVSSMHDRKALMADLADGFIVLPGGLGTLEEFLEILTWAQLGIHHKPVGVLNVSGYYDILLEFLDQTVAEQFVRDKNRKMVLVEEHPEALLDRFEQYTPPDVRQWEDDSKT